MPASVAKLVGADFELGNFVLGLRRSQGSGPEAARLLLAQIDGVPASGSRQLGFSHSGGSAGGWSGSSFGGWSDVQDQGRKFLRENGGCAYIDLDHLELCIPEVLSAHDSVAATFAMLRIAQQAARRANAQLPDSQTIQVLVNNSDGRSNSYGSHLNFLLTREAWDDILRRKPHYLQLLASHQASSLVYTGQGKVGSENGRPDVRYQLSKRADFVEMLSGPQTTYDRPLVNSRDESLCGGCRELARLHVIFFDNTLCHAASLLKVGTMQIVLAMLEAQAVDRELLVEDPVAAAHTWSHDPSLRARVSLVSGARDTAVELQQRFLDAALRHRDAHGFASVPRVDEILALWEDTLGRLASGDLEALVGRLDWVLKLHALEAALAQRSDLDWSSPALKYLDHRYGSLDPDDGLYWAYAARGVCEPVVSEAEIGRFLHDPPDDTRAWTRARLLRRFDAEEIQEIDWDHITIGLHTRNGWRRYELRLDDPLGFTRNHAADLFECPSGRSNP